MNNKVLEYMIDFEKSNLAKSNNIIIIDGSNVKHLQNAEDKDASLFIYSINDTEAYAKQFNKESLNGIASSRMYNDLGIATPIITPLTFNQEERLASARTPAHITRDVQLSNYLTASQNVYTLEKHGIEVMPAYLLKDLKDLYDRKDSFRKNIWNCLDEECVDKLMNIMTKECFDQCINKMLIEELRTYTDAHFGNLFFCKKLGAKKWETVVPIDLEFSEALEMCLGNTNKEFKRFINIPYSSFGITGLASYPTTHAQRLQDIASIIQQGKLKNENISVLKQALEYNLPESMKALTQKYNITAYSQEVYDKFSRLWEYNSKTLEKEL